MALLRVAGKVDTTMKTKMVEKNALIQEENNARK